MNETGWHRASFVFHFFDETSVSNKCSHRIWTVYNCERNEFQSIVVAIVLLCDSSNDELEPETRNRKKEIGYAFCPCILQVEKKCHSFIS